MEKEILIALECILKMFQSIPLGAIEARNKYLESTIKRIEEVIKGA